LASLTDYEKAQILDALIARNTTLAARADREGRRLLARVDVDDVAATVADAILGLSQEELSQHAGRTRYGYVEPTEAAWMLLEAALQPWLDDIARHAQLGFGVAAAQIGLGVLTGLRQAGDGGGNDERLLSWAPDFTYEAGESVRQQLAAFGIELTDAASVNA
jgi:hypothetical protein